MRHRHHATTVLVLGLLLPACTAPGPGSGADASPFAADLGLDTISCDVVGEADQTVTVHYCMEAAGLDPDDRAAAAKECAGLMGTLGTGCPPATVGSCLAGSSGYAMTTFFYSDGVETGEEAQRICDASGGTWTSSL